MSKRKPKPATVGEKMTIRWYGVSKMDLSSIREASCQWSGEANDLARRIDAALRRERLKERRRCSRIVVAYIGSEIGACEMLAKVRSGEEL